MTSGSPFEPHQADRHIVSRLVAVGWMFALAHLFTLSREVALAWRYGISREVDIYQLALTAVTWLPFTLTGILVPVLVPRLVRLRASPEARKAFLAELNMAIVAVALLLAAGIYLLAPALPALLDALSPAVAETLVGSVRIMAPVAAFVCLSGFLIARLQASGRSTYALNEAIPPFVLTLCILLLPATPALLPLLAGALLGTLLQTIWLALLKRRDGDGIGRWRNGLGSPEWKSLAPLLAVMAAAQLLLTAAIPIDQAWAAGLDEGSVATLAYASRIVGLFTGIGIVVLARATLPTFAEMADKASLAQGNALALRWALLCFGAGIALALFGWAASGLIVELLLERGAFTAADTRLVVEALRFGLLQIPVFLVAIVLIQWLSAAGRFRAMLIANGLALVVKIAANALLVGTYGVAGIFLSTFLMYAVIAGTLLIYCLRLGRSAGPAG